MPGAVGVIAVGVPAIEGIDYHIHVREVCCGIAAQLNGKHRIMVDNSKLAERYIAFKAGIGFPLKSGMLACDEYGTYFNLGMIVVDTAPSAEVVPLRPMNPENADALLCVDCTLCMDACPTGVLRGECDFFGCVSYINQVESGIAGSCDICQKVCLYNKTHIPINRL
jgi:epoxyqueuosine reductase